jgi:hypothetical protein
LDSFLSDEKSVIKNIKDVDKELCEIESKINKIEESISDLEKNKPLEEQALKVKLKIENLLEEKINYNLLDSEDKIQEKKDSIKNLKKEIKDKYNLQSGIKKAQDYINTEMNKIGENLSFEYKPINLKFSLDTFELWHERQNGSKIFLRSMGSGANWLSCHIALFTSIHRYLCSLGEKALIPSILFFDQPSQVYFPTSIDNKEEFDPKDLKEKENKIEKLDEDLSAVTNLFDQLVIFCESTYSETGIKPQIIITDHADNLSLTGSSTFDDLVKDRRWRKRGFIEIK